MILAPFSSCCSCSFRSKKGSNVLFPGALPLASAGVGALEHIFTIFHLYNIHNFCTSLLTRAKRFWGRPPAILGDGAANQFRHRWSHLCRSLSETPRVRFAAPLRRCERRLRREASRWCRTGLTGLISHPKTIGTRPVTLEHEPNDAGWLWQRNSSWRPPSIPGCLPGHLDSRALLFSLPARPQSQETQFSSRTSAHWPWTQWVIHSFGDCQQNRMQMDTGYFIQIWGFIIISLFHPLNIIK